jgi:hypothetical protein
LDICNLLKKSFANLAASGISIARGFGNLIKPFYTFNLTASAGRFHRAFYAELWGQHSFLAVAPLLFPAAACLERAILSASSQCSISWPEMSGLLKNIVSQLFDFMFYFHMLPPLRSFMFLQNTHFGIFIL